MKRLVPENKLLIAVGLVFLPLSLIIMVRPGFTAGAFIIVIGLSLLAIADALRASGQLEGLQVLLPEIVRLSMDRNGEFEVRIINDGALKKRIRIGLPFPPEIETALKDRFAVLPAGAAESSLTWPCTGLRLGDYRIQTCYVEVPSHLGLWAMRTSMPAGIEIRVYPNLLRERKGLTSLFLNRGFGIHAQRQVGKGREFEQLREYQHGDSYEDIHWKSTARRRQPITKVYQIERTQQIYVVVDSSRLSQRLLKMNSNGHRSSTGHRKPTVAPVIDRYISASLLMCMAAERQDDLFGLLTFNDKVNHFIAAKNGKNHFSTCRNALYRLKAKKVTPDFRELFTFISSRVRRRSLLIFLTHLDDPILAESFCSKIDLISRKHLVLVNMMRPLEARPVFSSEDVSSVDDIYQALGGHMIWQGLRETEMILQRRGVGVAMLENENLCPELISQYLALKRRQIL